MRKEIEKLLVWTNWQIESKERSLKQEKLFFKSKIKCLEKK